MVPHRTRRGKIALEKLKVFEGIPPPYDKQKRVCVPLAMKILCLRSDRKFCQVGRVAHEVGWHYREVVSSLEAKRKIKARLHYNHKQRLEVRKSRIPFFDMLLTIPPLSIHRKSEPRLHKRCQRDSPSKTPSWRSSALLHRKMRSSPSLLPSRHKYTGICIHQQRDSIKTSEDHNWTEKDFQIVGFTHFFTESWL